VPGGDGLREKREQAPDVTAFEGQDSLVNQGGLPTDSSAFEKFLEQWLALRLRNAHAGPFGKPVYQSRSTTTRFDR
jgi:hypothetical protein